MKRRNFVKQSGLLVSTTLLPTLNFSMTSIKKYKMGLQAFTIRDAMEKDLIGSLKTVKSLGYEDLELYGFDSENIGYYGMKAQEFKNLLDDMGLTASSCHYGFTDFVESSDDDLKRYVDAAIKGAFILNTPYITWPWLDPKYRNKEGFYKLPRLLNMIGEQVTKAGLGFAYHNHGFEFDDHDSEIGYDIILKNTDPNLVKLQLDLYWAVHSSKESPINLIAKDPERFVMWHIKDMDKVTRDYSELGNGSIDYIKMLPELNKSGLQYYYLEQGGNFAENSMQSITDSANYFKKHLKHFL